MPFYASSIIDPTVTQSIHVPCDSVDMTCNRKLSFFFIHFFLVFFSFFESEFNYRDNNAEWKWHACNSIELTKMLVAFRECFESGATTSFDRRLLTGVDGVRDENDLDVSLSCFCFGTFARESHPSQQNTRLGKRRNRRHGYDVNKQHSIETPTRFLGSAWNSHRDHKTEGTNAGPTMKTKTIKTKQMISIFNNKNAWIMFDDG